MNKISITVVKFRTNVGQIKPILPSPLSNHNNKWNFEHYDEKKSYKPPDLIMLDFDRNTGSFFKFCKMLRRRWGFTPFLLCSTGERRNVATKIADWTISYAPNSRSNYYQPVVFNDFLPMLQKGINHRISDSRSDNNNLPASKESYKLQKEYITNPKNRFCNFIYRHYEKKYPGTIKRVELCRMLANYKNVDCAGDILNNTDELRQMEEKNISNKSLHPVAIPLSPLRIFMSHYKFNIAFENESYPYYTTEKLWNSFIVGSIPIYWGCPQVTQFFNPKAFINCHDYNTFDEVIAKVKEIDNNPELYQEYLNAPPILPSSLYHKLNHDYSNKNLNKIIQMIIERKKIHTNQKNNDWLIKELKILQLRLQNINLEYRQLEFMIKKFLIIFFRKIRLPKRVWKAKI